MGPLGLTPFFQTLYAAALAPHAVDEAPQALPSWLQFRPFVAFRKSKLLRSRSWFRLPTV